MPFRPILSVPPYDLGINGLKKRRPFWSIAALQPYRRLSPTNPSTSTDRKACTRAALESRVARFHSPRDMSPYKTAEKTL
jgi:hypothetical protein